jgi:hypothetical protein
VTPIVPRLFRDQGDWSLVRATFSVLMVAAAIVVVFLALTREVPRPPAVPSFSPAAGPGGLEQSPAVARDDYEAPLPGGRHANCRPGCSP